MKKIILFLAIVLSSLWSYGQSVLITGSSSIEVGVPFSFTATFTPADNTNPTVVQYEWTTPFNGEGEGGQSGVVGHTNGVTSSTETDPLIIESTSTANTIPIQWGDGNSFTDDVVEVSVVFVLNGVEARVSASFSVTIQRIETPTVFGPNTIPDCCTNIINYTEASDGNHNTWMWTVTGGEITTGQGTSSIQVMPDPGDENVVVTCTVGRSAANSSYTRSTSRTTTRTTPNTPTVDGPRSACVIGEVYNYCLSNTNLCNFSSVIWEVPSEFEIVSTGASCINLRLIESSNTPVVLRARVALTGGCTTSVRNTGIVVGSPNIPEVSVGFLPCESLIFLYDDANNYPGFTYDWEFSGLSNKSLFVNGDPAQLRVRYGEGEIFCVDRVRVSNDCGSVVWEGPICYETPACDGETIIMGVPIGGDSGCESDADCMPGYECFNGECRLIVNDNLCEDFQDCPPMHFCVDGVCVPIPGFQSPDSDGIEVDNLVNVFPNPIVETINFSFFSMNKGTAVVRIYDGMGREILHKEKNYEVGENNFLINQIGDLPKGTLFYSIETLEFTQHGKLMNLKD